MVACEADPYVHSIARVFHSHTTLLSNRMRPIHVLLLFLVKFHISPDMWFKRRRRFSDLLQCLHLCFREVSRGQQRSAGLLTKLSDFFLRCLPLTSADLSKTKIGTLEKEIRNLCWPLERKHPIYWTEKAIDFSILLPKKFNKNQKNILVIISQSHAGHSRGWFQTYRWCICTGFLTRCRPLTSTSM